jgi:AcrR family transcriptional regulator
MSPAERSTASSKTRDRMLACGRRIVARDGVRSLTVRGVAAQAKVNLGTFVYHFGTREGFIAELMESWYAPIYAQLLDVSADDSSPPLVRLRRFILRLAAFMADNRRFMRNLFIDAAGDEEAAIKFIKSLLGRHPLLMFALIREAQAAGELREGDPVKMGLALFGASLFPSVLIGLLMPERLMPSDLQPFLEDVFAPAEIEHRFELALRGLATDVRAAGPGDDETDKKAKPRAMKSKTVNPKAMNRGKSMKRRSTRPTAESRS